MTSFSSIPISRACELVKFNINNISRGELIQDLITLRRTPAPLKTNIIEYLCEYLETDNFFNKDTPEACVDDVIVPIVTKILYHIKKKFGIKNILRKRELKISGIFENLKDDEKEAINRRMEVLVFLNRDTNTLSEYLLNPIIVIENKRPSIDFDYAESQCILALHQMDILSGRKENVYGIVCNGRRWELIRYSYNNFIRISMSEEFLFPNIQNNLDAFNENSLLIDVIYTIVLDYFRINV